MNSKVKEIISWIASLFLYIGIALLIRMFIFNITAVDGLSMYPSLDNGDKLITQKVSLYYREPEVGEIVVLEAPSNPKDNYIKRVIAKEGDEVRIEDLRVYINGEEIDEPYINEGGTSPNIPEEDHWLVPEDHIFVMGDNRGASNDSRSFGPIHEDTIIGISEFRILPIAKFGKL